MRDLTRETVVTTYCPVFTRHAEVIYLFIFLQVKKRVSEPGTE